MTTPSFADSVGALRDFFGVPETMALTDALSQMNTSMGLATGSETKPLPELVEQLVKATGIRVQASGAAADTTAGPSSSRGAENCTSLPGLGGGPDPKLAKSLSKHIARQNSLTAPPPDERRKKIFNYQEHLRTPPEDDGVSTHMPSGLKSQTPSMLTCPPGTEPEEFGPFANVANYLAASPPLRSYAPPKGNLSGQFRVV